jgi:hypothetical protein
LKGNAFVMLLISLTMRRNSWKGFHKMASRDVSSTYRVAGRSLLLRKGTIVK